MFKHALNNSGVQFLIGRLIGLYMHLVGVTTRWRVENRAAAERVWAGGEGVVACIWHGRFMLVHKLWSFKPGVQPAKMLISQSREGGVVTHASRTVGADVIRGSSAKGAKRKGGVEAMRAMTRHVRGGGVMCMTPDGPKGPRMRAKLGPVQLAKLAGAPLFPLAWSTRWRLTMKSWDQFLLPLPFGPGALVWGEPIAIPEHADADAIEAVRLALEAELNRISAEADRLAGAPVIEPAPLKAGPEQATSPAV